MQHRPDRCDLFGLRKKELSETSHRLHWRQIGVGACPAHLSPRITPANVDNYCLIFAGTQVLAVVRVLRVLRMLRIFRLLQVSQFAGEVEALAAALMASATRFTVFLATVLTIVVIMGSVMYLVEGDPARFDSVPRGIYWAIVTLTTVGYVDIAPSTALGQTIAATILVSGYAIIAVVTGIVSVEMAKDARKSGFKRDSSTICDRCGLVGHGAETRYCQRCGEALTQGVSE